MRWCLVFGIFIAKTLATYHDNLARRDLFEAPGVSQACQRDYKTIFDQLNNQFSFLGKDGFWALKMYDSFGTFPSDGLLQLNSAYLGSYYSCLEVSADTGLATATPFQGQYCAVYSGANPLKPDSNDSITRKPPLLPPFTPSLSSLMSISPKLSICVPSSCSRQDIVTSLNQVAEQLTTDEFQPFFVPFDCNVKGEQWNQGWDAGEWVMASILLLFLTIVIVGTLYDIQVRDDPSRQSPLGQVLVGFSFHGNLKKLFNTNRPKSQITNMDGIRFFSMSWVMVCHTITFYSILMPVNNMIAIPDLLGTFGYRVILNGFVSVDSFFVLSGLLVGYLTFKELDKSKGRLNIPMYYIHRYLRLTAVYAIIIGFHATFYRYFAVGPLTFVEYEVQTCRTNWWRNLLYINNFPYNGGSEFCLGQSWYLSTDMQIFIAAPLMLIPMWWLDKRFGLRFSLAYGVVWLLGVTVTLIGVSIEEHWPATSILDFEETNYITWNYMMPWIRCQPYIVGVMVGFLMNKYKTLEIAKTKKTVTIAIVGWVLAFGSGLAIVYGLEVMDPLISGITNLTEAETIIYGSFHRLGWALCLCWVIVACHYGFGGIINTFLSWEFFAPLSRLTFVMFLVHQSVINVIAAQFTFGFTITTAMITLNILNVLVITCVISIFIVVMIEMPLLTAEKALFSALLTKSKGGKGQ